MEIIGKIFASLILFTIEISLKSFMFMKAWTWFILSIFSDLPKLSFGESIGVFMFLVVVRYRGQPTTTEKNYDELFYEWFVQIFGLLVLFLIVYIMYLIIY